MQSNRPPRIREWKSLDRVWNILIPSLSGTASGVLLIGPSELAEQKAFELASQRQGAEQITFRKDDRSDVLGKRLREVLEPQKQLSLFDPPKLFPVVVVISLEDYGEAFYGPLKSRLEGPPQPWLCIATCESERGIPDYVSSMFYHVRALKMGGRPRKEPPGDAGR